MNAKRKGDEIESPTKDSPPPPGTTQTPLPDDPAQLITRLKDELRRLAEAPGEAGEEGAARSVLSLLRHAHTLAWRGVARGDLDLPGRILSLLRRFQRFVDLNTPALPPQSLAALEVRSTMTAFFIAHESLAEARAEVRLADRQRSALEREVLRILAESPESHLRRGQVHNRLRLVTKPSRARVGQVLAQLSAEGLLKRVHDSAQGNPETAYYGLSSLGYEVSEKFLERNDRAVYSSIQEILRQLNTPSTKPDAQVRHRIALALFSQVAFSNDMQHFAKVAYHGYKCAMAGASPERAEQALLVLNGVAADLAAASVVERDDRRALALTHDPKRWDLVPKELREPPELPGRGPAQQRRPDTPSMAPQLPHDELEELFAKIRTNQGELALVESFA